MAPWSTPKIMRAEIAGVDPGHVEIVAAGGSDEGFEGLAAVGGAIHRGLRDVEHVGILGIDEDAAEVFAANHARVLGGLLPGRAAIIRAEEPLVQDRVQTASTGSRERPRCRVCRGPSQAARC